jgi:DNA-binding CsgD family transcriptional regulator/tetratricopeptide (TPR) repeat protein
VVQPVSSPVLIGREREVAAVRQAALSARAGAGGLVAVTGEAGVGKSRLLGEAVELARGMGMTVLTGRAVPDGGAFRPVAEALYGHLRGTAAPDSDEVRPFRPVLARLLPGGADTDPAPGVDPLVVLGEAVLRLLRQLGGATGCVLVLEDLHWADRDTLGVLDYLAGAVAGSRVLVAVSSRGNEDRPELLRRLAGRPGVVDVPLERLDRETAARLASACAGGHPLPDEVVEFLVDAAEGLPFLVEELLAGLLESGVLDGRDGWRVRGALTARVPQTLADLVRSRTAALPPEQLLVVRAAAVLGRSIDWNLLAPVAGVPEDVVVAALRAAVSAQLLQVGPAPPGQFAWRHALVRDAVLAELLPPEHTRLARAAAEAMEVRDPGLAGPDAVLIAELYARGDRPEQAAGLLTRLARAATADGALRTADVVLTRAAGLGAGAEAAVELVRVRTMSGRAEEALAAGEEALRGAGGEARVELALALARAAVTVARWEPARDYLDRADRPDDPRVHALAADVAYGAGDVARALALAEPAVHAARRAGLWAVACEALEVVGRCHRMADPVAAAAAFRRAADLAEAHGLVPWRIRALQGLGFSELLATETSAHLEQARQLAQDAGMLAEVAGIDMVTANATGLIHGPVAALPLAERGRGLAATLRLRQVEAKSVLFIALCHASTGDTDQMRSALDEANRLDPGAADVVSIGRGVVAVSALLDRDLATARDLLDEAVAVLREHPTAAPVQDWGLWVLVRTALADRDALARDELRERDVLARAINRGALDYADAIAAGRDGRAEDAAALLAAGDSVLATQHWWRGLLRLLVLEAALADGWGNPVEELRAALAAFDAAGEPRLARTCRDLLRRAGAPVPRRGRGQSAVPPRLRAVGVTSREMDVLALVAQGLTNAQIAQRLFLSSRTIETHVANLLRKTGTAVRGDLAPYAVAQTR